MIEFMSNEKSFADAKTTPSEGKKTQTTDGTHDHKHKRNGHAGRNGTRGKRMQFSPPSADETCRIHGGHTWGNCYNNPRGVHANKQRAPGGRNNGRGGRGGFQARGNSNGGRGNGNRNAGQYHFEPATPEATAVQGQQHTPANKGTRGTLLSSITLTLSVKAPNTDGNPALGIQVNIKLHKQLHCLDNRKVFLVHQTNKQKLIITFFLFVSSTFLTYWRGNGRRILLCQQQQLPTGNTSGCIFG
jgi:hypothetical protein